MMLNLKMYKFLFLACFVFINNIYCAPDNTLAPHDFIQELKTIIPSLDKDDLNSLFGEHAETFAKLQVFAKAIEKRDKFVITSKNLQTFLSADNLKTFARYVASDEFQNRIETMQARNPILVALAKKWIRNAALRIFADILRSFLELIVNACDATVGPEKAIGKFGLGFFSVLGFLSFQETDGTVINLKTIARSDFGLPGYFAYSMTFDKTGPALQVWDDLSIKFKQLNEGELYNFLRELKPSYNVGDPMPTGTIITIKPKNAQKNFSDSTLNLLKNYVAYMTRYPWIPIYLNDASDPVNKDAVVEDFSLTNKCVNVSVLPDKLEVIDRGSGITLSVALSSLLIPSSSTKPKSSLLANQEEAFKVGAPDPNFMNLPHKSDKNKSHFLITINGVVVVDKVIPEPIKNADGSIVDFQISMPQATQLTLSRDEIVISEDGKSFAEAYLKNIIDKTFSDVFQKKLEGAYLSAFYKGLSAWEMQSASRHLKGRFTGYFKQVLQNQLQRSANVFAVPEQYFSKLSEIFEFFAGVQALNYLLLPLDGVLVNYNFSKFESTLIDFCSKKILQAEPKFQDLLERAINFNLIRGMRVVFVSDDILNEIKTLGMPTVLFVPEKELTDLSNVAENIVAKYSEMDLALSYKLDFSQTCLVVSTFTDRINWQSNNNLKLENFDLVSINLSEQFCANSNFGFLLRSKAGKFSGMLTDKKILNLLGIGNVSDLKTADKYLNFVLFAALSRLGVTAESLNDGNIFVTESNGQLMRLWPVDKLSVQKIGLLMMSCLWCLANNYNLRDYFIEQVFVEISHCFVAQTLAEQLGQNYASLEFHPGVGVEAKKILEPLDILGFKVEPDPLTKILKLGNSQTAFFVGYPDSSPERLDLELQDLFKFISPAINYDQTLRFACPGFSATNAFLELFLFKKSVDNAIKNEKAQQDILNLIQAISGFYSQYCNIPESEFAKIYGSRASVNVIVPALQCDPGIMVDFLNAICFDKKIFNYVLQLQLNDFANQTDVLLRAQDLVDGKIYVPMIGANTVLSLLSTFFDKLQDFSNENRLALIRQVIDSVGNEEELCFVLQILMVDDIFAVLASVMSLADGDKFDLLLVQIKDLIQRFIHEKIDEYFISDFYKKCRTQNLVSLDARIEVLAQMPISKIVQEFLQSILIDKSEFKDSDYRAKIDNLVKDSKSFSLRRLMRAHFTGVGLKTELQQNNLKKTLKKINKVRSLVDSWKITQAVEAGSQRGGAESSAIECLQNSVDAIRSFFKALKKGQDLSFKQSFNFRGKAAQDLFSINFDLNFIETEGDPDSSILLTVQDFIGMPTLESLLADLVLPDYSKKTPAEGNVGDMGNGIFKIYQAAQEVCVTTRLISDPDKIFVLQIIPSRNEDGLVDDLDMKCAEVKPVGQWQLFWGTKFEIRFKERKKTEALIEAVAIKDFIKNSAGATNVWIEEQKKPVLVYFNDEQINKNFVEEDVLTEYRNDDGVLFKVYKRENKFLQSYITTVGVPFRPLLSVAYEMNLLPKNFVSMLSRGLIINLELGTYQPVQSRARLNVSDKILKSLKECLLEVFYLYTIDLYQDSRMELGSIFTHFLSTSGYFDQVKLNADEKISFDKNTSSEVVDKRVFFQFYQSLLAKQNKKQQPKSFFDFVNKEFTGGLVSQAENLKSSYQVKIDKLFEDKALTDEVYTKRAKDLNSKFESELNKLFVGWKTKTLSSGFVPKVLIEKVVIPWFEVKKSGVRLNVRSRSLAAKIYASAQNYKNKISATVIKNIKDLLNYTLTAYSDVYFKLNRVPGRAPKTEFGVCEPGELGYFDQSKNEIIISPARPKLVTNLLKMVKHLIKKDYQEVKDNDAYNLLFGIRRGAKCGVVTHELLHAVIHTSDFYHAADFEDQAKQRVVDIISDLFPEWMAQTIKLYDTSQKFILDLIDKNIKIIEKFETEDQQALFAVIF